MSPFAAAYSSSADDTDLYIVRRIQETLRIVGSPPRRPVEERFFPRREEQSAYWLIGSRAYDRELIRRLTTIDG